MNDFEYAVYIVLIGLYSSTQMTLDSVMSSVLCHRPLPAVTDFIDRSRQTAGPMESGSAPRFLPVEKQFFFFFPHHCRQVFAHGGKCWVSVNESIMDYGLDLHDL